MSAETTAVAGSAQSKKRPFFNFGMLGVASPVFPGFEVDILDRVPDDEKPDAVWHRERARAMLKAHPEIRDLFGHYPLTAFWCVLAAGLQIGLAVAASYTPWWGMILLAYILGGPINIILFQLAHECDHKLVFKGSAANRWLFTLTSIPMFLSGHHTWWVDHIVHHNDMGATKDFITRRRTFFIGTRAMSPLLFPFSSLMVITQLMRSILGLVLYVFTSLIFFRLKPTRNTMAVLADRHLISGYEKEGIETWAASYPLLALTTYGLLFWLCGWQAVCYLFLAQIFFTGFLHPYNLGWVLGISHFHGRSNYQPTASHYGALINLSTFNAGLHVEHHDLMAIPWFRLWKLRRLAPEFYQDLETIPSYTALGMKFVFAGRQTFEDRFNTESHRNMQRFAEKPLDTASETTAT